MIKYKADELSFDNSNPSGRAFRSHVERVSVESTASDDRLSLAPLDPLVAMRALLQTPPLKSDD